MVTLFGSILARNDKEILFSIAVDRGDARQLGLCGQVWFASRTLIGGEATQDGYDVIRMPFQVASLKAQGCQPCD